LAEEDQHRILIPVLVIMVAILVLPVIAQLEEVPGLMDQVLPVVLVEEQLGRHPKVLVEEQELPVRDIVEEMPDIIVASIPVLAVEAPVVLDKILPHVIRELRGLAVLVWQIQYPVLHSIMEAVEAPVAITMQVEDFLLVPVVWAVVAMVVHIVDMREMGL